MARATTRGKRDDGFYIHFADPGFPDPPWPGERRLGPFPTPEEAHEQAASDVAHGHVTEDALAGVFSAEESEKRRVVLRTRWEEHLRDNPADDLYDAPVAFDPCAHRAGRAHVPPSRIVKRAQTVRKRLLSLRAMGIEDQRLTLEAMLPEGVTYGEMMEVAQSPEALVKLLGEKLS